MDENKKKTCKNMFSYIYMELMFSSERIKNMLYIINYNDVPESQIRVIKSQIRVIPT